MSNPSLANSIFAEYPPVEFLDPEIQNTEFAACTAGIVNSVGNFLVFIRMCNWSLDRVLNPKEIILMLK